MKKILSILLVMLLIISFTACATPTPAITAMSELSEIEVSELLRQHITPDMSHEDVFSKLEALGFVKTRDVSIAYYLSGWYESVEYSMGDVFIVIGLDIEYHIDIGETKAEIGSYKSELITVHGTNYVEVYWYNNRKSIGDSYVVPERVAEQRTIQSFLNENIKLGDDFITATELIEEFGFVLTEYYGADKSSRVYQYDNYTLRIRSSNRNVDNMYLVYEDVLFDKRMEN